VVGARATRTTHPQALAGFRRILSAVLGQPFDVSNPYAWITKSEVIERIVQSGCADLITHTRSCTRVAVEMDNDGSLKAVCEHRGNRQRISLDEPDAGTPCGPDNDGATAAGEATEPPEEDEGVRPIPDRLVTELTAHRTLALRDALSEDEIAEAVRVLYTDTHNVAEGAGAASFAAMMKQRGRLRGMRVGLVLSGGNIDMPILSRILRGETPEV
jgi:hypothetical protein